MSGVIVNSTTQRLVLDPATSSISVINAGPQGPPGPQSEDNLRVLRTGDTMTGQLNVGQVSLNLDGTVGCRVISLSEGGYPGWAWSAGQGYSIFYDVGGGYRQALMYLTGTTADTGFLSETGRHNVGSSADLGATLGVQGTSPTRVTQIIRLATGVTADAFQIQDPTGAAKFRVDADGAFAANSAYIGPIIGDGVGNQRIRFDGTSNSRITSLGLATVAASGGDGVVGIANSTVAPTSNPSNGGILYVEAGSLKWRGSSGGLTTIATSATLTKHGVVYQSSTVTPSASQLTSSTAVDVPGLTITIPQNGDYDISASVRGMANIPIINSAAGITVGLYTSANVLIANTEYLILYKASGNATTQVDQLTSTATWRIVGATSGTIYKIRCWNVAGNTYGSATSDNNGRACLSYRLIT